MNTATYIVCALLFVCVIIAVFIIVRNRKKGKSSCGGDCSNCNKNCK